MKAIKDEIARLEIERDAITNQINGLKTALRLVSGESTPVADLRVPHKERQRRGRVKNTVLDIVTRAGAEGISVIKCVEKASEDHGIILARASVSSLLSRLKKDEVLFYDGDRYRLKEYAGPRHAA